MHKQYFPNYEKLYPNTEISEEILIELRKSDNKIKYTEYDLKHGNPSREISLEIFLRQKPTFIFQNEYANPEKEYLKKERILELYRCISLLKQEEKLLLFALFWDELTELEYAEIIDKNQSTVNRMKKKIIDKLRESFDW
ncbi:MAG: hypothetical protein LBM93_00295 [Oscillospiraceae bacterium]|jgi:RNA polymerase sigma factor (sigma-70 family)|nr:hypothetical protein [Oscillospiraceae bacterium]